MQVHYMLPLNSPLTGTENEREIHMEQPSYPAKDESVLFIDTDGTEFEFYVNHVVHVFDGERTPRGVRKYVQVVLREP